MPVTWVRVKHEKHGGETDIPEVSLASYEERGWHPVKPAEEEKAPAPTTSTTSTRPAQTATTTESKE